MAKIYKVNQLPYDDLVTDESAIYYNYNTREIILKTTRGVEKFQAMVPPKSFDAFSVNGYFPLYFSAAEAELHSPVYESISYGEEELGPPPPNVTYPVFMPLGLTEFYDGDYVDPLEDDNDNGVLNFRDPQEVGIVALPVLDYARQDPFTTPTGTVLSVNDYISKADVGTYNDTDEPVAVCTPFPAVIFDGAGDVSYVDGPGAGVIPSGGVLFKDIHQTSTVLTEPSVAYTADPFVSFGGVSVNISEYLPNGFSSILENVTGSSYSIYVIKSGIIVSSVGEVTYFLPGQLTLNHGDTVFYSQSSSSSLEPTETIYVEDNFVYDACNIELKEYFGKDPIDGGSYNHMTSDVLVITHTDGVIINPSTCSVTSTQSGIVTLPPGNFLITKISKVLLRFIACTAGSAISVQWFEEDSEGSLVLRTEAFDSSNPAIQYWEFEGDNLVPREFAYSSTTESAQYFELDDSGYVVPVEGDGSTTGSGSSGGGSSGGGSSGGGTGGGTTDISYNVSTNPSIVFGSISNVSPTAALVGETVSFDVSAETNFQIDTVTATQDSNSSSVSLTNNGGGNYSFSMPADNVTLNATFVAQDTDGDGISDLDDPNINDYNYTVSIDPSTNGALSVDNSTPIFGTAVTITAVPSSGYETSTITVTEDGGATVSVSGTGDSRTFTMPATNVTVSGRFVPPHQQLTAVVNADGKIEVSFSYLSPRWSGEGNWFVRMSVIGADNRYQLNQFIWQPDYTIDANGNKVYDYPETGDLITFVVEDRPQFFGPSRKTQNTGYSLFPYDASVDYYERWYNLRYTDEAEADILASGGYTSAHWSSLDNNYDWDYYSRSTKLIFYFYSSGNVSYENNTGDYLPAEINVPDSDGDGVWDSLDAFPNDSSQWD